MNTKRRLSLVNTVAIILATVFHCGAGYAAEHIIEIKNFKYVTDRVQVRAGDVITWINKDIVPHTATAEDASWDSGEISPGQSKQVVLPEHFSLQYYCVYHPSMRGNL